AHRLRQPIALCKSIREQDNGEKRVGEKPGGNDGGIQSVMGKDDPEPQKKDPKNKWKVKRAQCTFGERERGRERKRRKKKCIVTKREKKTTKKRSTEIESRMAVVLGASGGV